MSAGEIKGSRKLWTREETLLLLQCYRARKDEIKHSRKKKYAFVNVLEDMFGQGFSDTTVTIEALEAKMRTLLIANKSAKDNNRQTGATYCQALFMEEMDEIFGREPIISNSHALYLGLIMQRPLSDRCSLAAVEPCILPDPLLLSSQNTSSNTESLRNITSTSRGLSNYYRDPLGDVPSSSPESLCYVASNRVPLIIGTSNPRKRKSAKENYYEKKLELKRKFYEDIKIMISEKLNAH
ncbi:uncharacterized protein [Eurosta solidaginis]|uniref:uncharacterized protein n=1 Tax=Eurosta solidaginis TaxID=178769 RepID=UPI003530978E